MRTLIHNIVDNTPFVRSCIYDADKGHVHVHNTDSTAASGAHWTLLSLEIHLRKRYGLTVSFEKEL